MQWKPARPLMQRLLLFMCTAQRKRPQSMNFSWILWSAGQSYQKEGATVIRKQRLNRIMDDDTCFGVILLFWVWRMKNRRWGKKLWSPWVSDWNITLYVPGSLLSKLNQLLNWFVLWKLQPYLHSWAFSTAAGFLQCPLRRVQQAQEDPPMAPLNSCCSHWWLMRGSEADSDLSCT